MSVTYGRCYRCNRISSLLALTLLYKPPGTMRTARYCPMCHRGERQRQGVIKQEVRK